MAEATSPSSSASLNGRSPLLSQIRLIRGISAGGFRPSDVSSTRSLTTFSGVFTPVCLSMFSALLFLRVGYVVGQAGLLEVMLQLTLAYIILVCTVLSISAISTNGAVEGGGVYYMISRTLGPEFGGSIGTLFFFANIFSSGLYITGCVEGLIDNFGPEGTIAGGVLPASSRWWGFLYGSAVGVFNLLICLIGASMFARTSLIIFLIVMISAISVVISIVAQNKIIEVPLPNSVTSSGNETKYGVYTGLTSDTFIQNVYEHYSVDYTTGKVSDFATVFGVLFSGVTGIMAGANMSGDLKEPSRSIPRGTLTAVAFTAVVYFIMIFLTAGSCRKSLLLNDFIYMQGINLWPPFVAIGVFAATVSASLSTLIGASRVLEAVCRDDLFGVILRPLTRGVYKGNPIAAVFISWFLVQIVLLIGSLNEIAQVTSVLFLLSYCATNMACLGLELASAPNFRPSFKYFSWHTCIVGLIGTLTMMFVINAIYAACCIIACLLMIIALHLRSPASNWGSISQALIFHQVRKYLLLLDSRKDHVKFWRPHMLLLVANPRTCCPLIEFANDLKKSGLYVLGHVKMGTCEPDGEKDAAQDEYQYWLSLIDHLKVKAFVEITVAPTIREGMQHLVRIAGLGAMKPNTILLGFYDNNLQEDFFMRNQSPFHQEAVSVELGDLQHPFPQIRDADTDKPLSALEYVTMVQDAIWLQKNVCLCRHFQHLDKSGVMQSTNTRTIDVWPINFFRPDKHALYETTTLFLMQLACVLHMVSGWKKHTYLRVVLPTTTIAEDTVSLQKQLQELLKLLRIDASVSAIVWDSVYSLYKPLGSDEDYNLNTVTQEYISGVNNLIREHSHDTAISFMYLAEPPVDKRQHMLYLQLLDMLTSDLPPTVLVHGISMVTTTTL